MIAEIHLMKEIEHWPKIMFRIFGEAIIRNLPRLGDILFIASVWCIIKCSRYIQVEYILLWIGQIITQVYGCTGIAQLSIDSITLNHMRFSV